MTASMGSWRRARDGKGARAGGMPMSRALQALLALIAACAILYVRLFVPGPGNGADFVDFYAGAWAEAHGLDPFVSGQLWQAEKVLFHGAGYSGPMQVYTYKNPPPFALLIRPLADLSMSAAYWVWAGVILIVGFGAAVLFLHDWPPGPRMAGALALACCPAALWSYRVGQNAAFVALGLGLAVWLLARNRPVLAGAALTLGFMKPHLAVPIAIIFVLSVPLAQRRATLAGVLAGYAWWCAFAVAFDGGITRIEQWLSGLRGDTTLFAGQDDVAALPGLLYHLVPARYDGAITLGAALCAALVVAHFFRAHRQATSPSMARMLGGGICGCFCFLPYAHTSDQIVLGLLVLLLIRQDGSGLANWPVHVAAFVCVLAPLTLFHDHRTPVFDVLPPLSLLVAYWVLPSAAVAGTRAVSGPAPSTPVPVLPRS